MRVVFVSPAWRRYDVTRLALAQRAHLCGELAGRGLEATCVVVADDANLDIAGEYGFETVEQNNEFLGRRFNDGIEYACRKLGADLVVPIGSDDWMHPDLFDVLPDGEQDPPEMVTGVTVAFVNLETGRLRGVRAKGAGGAIPWVIPRSALWRSRFRPAGQKQRRGIDYSVRQGLGRVRLVFTDPHDLCRVDFKSMVNLNSYAEATGIGTRGPEEKAWRRLRTRYPDQLVGMAKDLHKQMELVAA